MKKLLQRLRSREEADLEGKFIRGEWPWRARKLTRM
jgi:hypothetical protein